MLVIGGQEKIRALCRGTISNNGDALDLCGLTEPNVERMELAARRAQGTPELEDSVVLIMPNSRTSQARYRQSRCGLEGECQPDEEEATVAHPRKLPQQKTGSL